MGESTGLPLAKKGAQTLPRQESEYSILRAEYSKLKNDEETKTYFKTLFEKYDRDGNGQLDVKELAKMLRDNNEVSDKLIRKLLANSDKNHDGTIDVDEFTAMVLDRKFRKIFENYAKSYVDLVVPQDKRHRYKLARGLRLEAGGQEVDGAVLPEGFFYPPPLCMILVSIIEIICYILNRHLTVNGENGNKSLIVDTEGPVARYLIYNPERRKECWRFLTYMMVHVGWTHLAVNLIIQIFFGVALEFRNRWWRVLMVYTAGVVAGSLVTSITDPRVYLAGASGGVYAIITGHLSNIILNWKDMAYPGVQLAVLSILVICDLSTAIYNRYIVHDTTPVGYAAHLGGALAGFLVGIWVLKNVEPTDREKYLWWTAFVVYILLMGTAVMLNIFWTGHFVPNVN